jgi:spermidine synthase
VRAALHTGVQEVVLVGGRPGPPDLYLNGQLKVSGRDEYRYHEALVHPAMRGPHARVLILGGGDGLAAREVLRHRGVRSVTVVELDPGVVRLARTDPGLAALNAHAYDDPRVRVVSADAFSWLRGSSLGAYDVIVSDLPDPVFTASSKLYSLEFYGLARGALADGGRLVVHAGPVVGRPRTYWTVEATLRTAGLHPRAYRAVPGAGSQGRRGAGAAPRGWGFLLAAADRAPRLGLDPSGPRLRSLTADALVRGARDAQATRLPGALPPSTLVHPRYTG